MKRIRYSTVLALVLITQLTGFCISAFGAAYLAEEGVAVFYQDNIKESELAPSLALVKKLSKKSDLPADWKLKPAWGKVTEKYKTFNELNNDGHIPMRYRAAFMNMVNGADLYGTGEQMGTLRRNDTTVGLYCLDNYCYIKGPRLYQSHPWVMGVRKDGSAFGIIADTTARGEIDLKNNSMIFDFEVLPFRVIVIEKESPQAVMRTLAELIGTIAMPPKWALGYQQCRWSYMNEAEGKSIIDNFRTRKLPCDVIWFDIDYMNGFRVFTFNKGSFPDPKRMNDYAHSNNFNTIWMIDPGIKLEQGYHVYDGLKKDLYVLETDPKLPPAKRSKLRGVTARTSSTFAPQHGARNIIDGNDSQVWASKDSDKPEWAIIDLGGDSEILNIDILWSKDFYPGEFDVEHSRDGEAWTKLCNARTRDSGGWEKIDPGTQVQARYLKVNFLKLGKMPRYEIAELKINGETFADPDLPADMFGGNVWPGLCAFPDYTSEKTSKWWASLYKEFMALGVDGVWNDMNEPAVFAGGPLFTMADTAYHRGGAQTASGPLPAGPHTLYHNAYGMLMAKDTRQGIMDANPDKRPFVLTRANYLGGHRYAATWTGDNVSTEAHMKLASPMCLNMGLSGQPFVGPDLGGFAGTCTAELWARWVSVGAFYPFMRGHASCGTKRKEPWAFGEETETAARIALNRRYRLIPYLYTAYRDTSLTGMPIMQPLFFADPKNTALRSEEDIFLCGTDLMVIPSWASKENLPAGDWKTISLVDGDKANKYQAEVRLRPGAILPLGKIVQSTKENSLEVLTLKINLDKDGKASGILYEDAGDGYGYKTGEFIVTSFTAVQKGKKVKVSIKKEEGKSPLPDRPVIVEVITSDGVVKTKPQKKHSITVKL